jgi:hypothetical protein
LEVKVILGLFVALGQDAAPVSGEAQYKLGRAYQTGKGVKKDLARAESQRGFTRLELCPNLGTVPYCQWTGR